MSSGILIESLTKTYRGGRVRALDDVTLSIKGGEVFGIIGPNGAGKTTLMGCLLGFLFPDRGAILIDDLPPDDLKVKAQSGYVPERLTFDRWMTGHAYLSYHHALSGAHDVGRLLEVDGMLQRVGLGVADGQLKIAKYSRGMLQRLGIAQALIGNPRFLFLDEPTSGMDPVGARQVRSLIREFRTRGGTVVINSHQLEQLEKLCDRVAFVRAGRVESVEVMKAGSEESRTLMVGFAGSPLAAPDREALARQAAEQSGASVRQSNASSLTCDVEDDESASRVVAALVSRGFPVISVVPEQGRLERLFQ